MNGKRMHILLLSVIVAMAALPSGGDAKKRVPRETLRPADPIVYGQFSAAGKYTGSLSGPVRIGDRSVTITPETKIYVRDQGIAERTPRVYSTAVYVTGALRDDGRYDATLVIVGPEMKRDYSVAEPGILEPDAPR